ncbi:MAG TPA: SDR family oxidoreductase [Kofleriaceae bacterium]|jgi:3-oxoacyl-[acyl-carrier protein] reductase|nr:SDR family oxidoreductase [Kofleriaceae bacterium]
MDLGIRGRTAMVAAGSKGLGRAIAAALVREGARVSICARSSGPLEETEKALRDAGGEVLAMTVDVSRPADLERWHTATLERWGHPALVVTNTGGPPPGLFETLTEDNWRAGIDSTLMNVVRTSQLVLPAMRAAKYGRIVHLTSFVAKQPMSLLTISSTLRAGLSALTKTMATQVAGDGITVNAILPGHFLTDRQVQVNELRAKQHGITRAAWEDKLMAEIPARRFGRPEELGDAVAFLLSERAAYVNGISLQVDGGLSGGTF